MPLPTTCPDCDEYLTKLTYEQHCTLSGTIYHDHVEEDQNDSFECDFEDRPFEVFQCPCGADICATLKEANDIIALATLAEQKA